MPGLLNEHGPCYANTDSNSTSLRDWSWNDKGRFSLTEGLPIADTSQSTCSISISRFRSAFRMTS